MNDREHAEEILQTARRDLRALRAMHDVEAFPDEIFGFFAQQSVEKALKAWLAVLGKPFPKHTISSG
jgi:HEPN domain-containing protein